MNASSRLRTLSALVLFFACVIAGFVAYEIKPDGTLDGISGGYGSDKTGTETAMKQ